MTHRRSARGPAAGMLALLLAGCGAGPGFTTAGQPGSAPPEGEAIRVFAGPCLGDPGRARPPVAAQEGFVAGAIAAPVVGAFASAFVQAAMTAIGNAAKAAGGDRTTTLVAAGAAPPFSRLDGPASCIQVVLGRFAGTGETVAGGPATGLDSTPARLNAIRVPMTAPPRLLVEYQIELAPGGANGAPAPAFRLRETWRVQNGTLTGGAPSATGQELVVSVHVLPFDAAIGDATPASVPVERSRPLMARHFDAATRVAPTTLWMPLSEDILAKPLNIIASVSETQNGNAFLAALGAALTDGTTVQAAGAAADTAARRALDPAARRDARLTALSAEQQRLDDALQLYEQAETAVSTARACAEPCPRLRARAIFYADLTRQRFAALRLPQPALDTGGL